MQRYPCRKTSEPSSTKRASVIHFSIISKCSVPMESRVGGASGLLDSPKCAATSSRSIMSMMPSLFTSAFGCVAGLPLCLLTKMSLKQAIRSWISTIPSSFISQGNVCGTAYLFLNVWQSGLPPGVELFAEMCDEFRVFW